MNNFNNFSQSSLSTYEANIETTEIEPSSDQPSFCDDNKFKSRENQQMLERITMKNNLLKNKINLYYETQKKQQIDKRKEKWPVSPQNFNTAVKNGFSDEKYQELVKNQKSGSKTSEKRKKWKIEEKVKNRNLKNKAAKILDNNFKVQTTQQYLGQDEITETENFDATPVKQPEFSKNKSAYLKALQQRKSTAAVPRISVI